MRRLKILEHSAHDIFSRVERLLGEDAARVWFTTPKKALDGEPPIKLLETQTGNLKLQEMLTALEDGSYL